MGKPLVLLIRDGWGIGPDYEGNAVNLAKTPNMDSILEKYPVCTLEASGEGVGVRAGSQGSSEVGHLNMGAGRIVEQEIVRVDKLIRSGELFKLPRLVEAIEYCKKNNSKFHLMGLVQDQGVHATQEHLFAMVKFLAEQGIEKVCIHFFTDGRDTAPRSALTFLDKLEKVIAEAGAGKVCSVMGRYYSMDRAQNWERTKIAYDALTKGEGFKSNSAKNAIEEAYARADAELKAREDGTSDSEDPVETDEFIRPTLMVEEDGSFSGIVETGDVVFHTNYRQDRAIQLTDAFVVPNFDKFDRGPAMDIFFIGMTRYYDEFEMALIPPMNMEKLFGEILAEKGLRQLRIAEFQKYKHVTSFFNGKLIAPFAKEDRILVDSITIPEDQKPEMSAYEVTDLMLTAINDGITAVRKQATAGEGMSLELESNESTDEQIDDTYDVIILNYANCDMVGHTGVLEAAVKAVETVDECVGKVVEAVTERGGMVFITADHGNSEMMIDPDSGKAMTSHTTTDVEFIIVSNDSNKYKLRDHGVLADIAPTMLDILGIETPQEMTAKSLLA